MVSDGGRILADLGRVNASLAAAIQSLMPVGEVVTTIQTAPTRREMVVHQGKTVANVDDPRSCRNKLAVEVKGATYTELACAQDRFGVWRAQCVIDV